MKYTRLYYPRVYVYHVYACTMSEFTITIEQDKCRERHVQAAACTWRSLHLSCCQVNIFLNQSYPHALKYFSNYIWISLTSPLIPRHFSCSIWLRPSLFIPLFLSYSIKPGSLFYCRLIGSPTVLYSLYNTYKEKNTKLGEGLRWLAKESHGIRKKKKKKTITIGLGHT